MRFTVTGRTIDQYQTRLGLQGDHHAETVEFVLDRYYQGVDLSEGLAFVLFSFESGKTGYVPGIAKRVEGAHLILTWLVGSEVTEETGVLKVGLRISGLEEVLWHSEVTSFLIEKTIPMASAQKAAFFSARMTVPDSEPPLTITERKFNIPPSLQNIAVQNDRQSETVKIRMPRYFDGHDLYPYTFYLRTVNKEKAFDAVFLLPQIEGNELVIDWVLAPPQTSVAGKLSVQLWVTGDDFDWQTEPTSVTIVNQIGGDPFIPVAPPVMDAFLKEIAIIAGHAKDSRDAAAISEANALASANKAQAEAERAEDVAVKTPYIGDDGYWYVWNLETSVYDKTDNLANGNTMFATFQIDTETGLMAVTVPRDYKGAQFQITDDYLEVMV